MPCLKCGLTGFLNWHGFITGESDKNDGTSVQRGHRIFCNNRGLCNGCGKTFSIYYSNIMPHQNISAVMLWHFLCAVVEKIPIYLIPIKKYLSLSITSAYRLWKRFQLNQTHIRSFLTRIHSPPELLHETQPELQCIDHLKISFEENLCAIAGFQNKFQHPFFAF